MARKGMVVARHAFVWVEGARPVEYEQITVIDRKTGQPVTMNSDRVVDQGSDGIPHTFKAYQRVPRNHPVVKAKPGYFMELDEVEDPDLVTA